MLIQTSEQIIEAAYKENDEEAYWSLITELHNRGSIYEFNLAFTLSQSGDPINREIGADILGQLGWRDGSFQDKSITVLIKLLSDEVDDVIASAAYALGHRNSAQAIKSLLKHQSNQNQRVRHTIVFGLLGLEDNDAINCLITLSEDSDDEVRNWATFGLGSQIETDTVEICNALEKRLVDDVAEIRGEAFVGLANRGHTAIIDKLILELTHNDVGPLMFEAAEILGHTNLYKPLESIRNTLTNNEGDYFTSCLSDALERCRDK